MRNKSWEIELQGMTKIMMSQNIFSYHQGGPSPLDTVLEVFSYPQHERVFCDKPSVLYGPQCDACWTVFAGEWFAEDPCTATRSRGICTSKICLVSVIGIGEVSKLLRLRPRLVQRHDGGRGKYNTKSRGSLSKSDTSAWQQLSSR